MVNGYFTGKFTNGNKIDIVSQQNVSDILQNVNSTSTNLPFKIDAISPTELLNMRVSLRDTKNNLWFTTIKVLLSLESEVPASLQNIVLSS